MKLYILAITCAVGALNAQSFTTLVNLEGTYGGAPNAPLVLAADGSLYGTGGQQLKHGSTVVY
jgi:hypothetical protein